MVDTNSISKAAATIKSKVMGKGMFIGCLFIVGAPFGVKLNPEGHNNPGKIRDFIVSKRGCFFRPVLVQIKPTRP